MVANPLEEALSVIEERQSAGEIALIILLVTGEIGGLSESDRTKVASRVFSFVKEVKASGSIRARASSLLIAILNRPLQVVISDAKKQRAVKQVTRLAGYPSSSPKSDGRVLEEPLSNKWLIEGVEVNVADATERYRPFQTTRRKKGRNELPAQLLSAASHS